MSNCQYFALHQLHHGHGLQGSWSEVVARRVPYACRRTPKCLPSAVPGPLEPPNTTSRLRLMSYATPGSPRTNAVSSWSSVHAPLASPRVFGQNIGDHRTRPIINRRTVFRVVRDSMGWIAPAPVTGTFSRRAPSPRPEIVIGDEVAIRRATCCRPIPSRDARDRRTPRRDVLWVAERFGRQVREWRLEEGRWRQRYRCIVCISRWPTCVTNDTAWLVRACDHSPGRNVRGVL
jgi:hypothetical protein